MNAKTLKNHIDFVFGKHGTYDSIKQYNKHKETCLKNRKKRKSKKKK
jgi:hypothetical protein